MNPEEEAAPQRNPSNYHLPTSRFCSDKASFLRFTHRGYTKRSSHEASKSDVDLQESDLEASWGLVSPFGNLSQTKYSTEVITNTQAGVNQSEIRMEK